MTPTLRQNLVSANRAHLELCMLMAELGVAERLRNVARVGLTAGEAQAKADELALLLSATFAQAGIEQAQQFDRERAA